MTDPQTELCFVPWWKELQADAGQRAALRRCDDTVSVMMLPAYHRLLWRVRERGFSNERRIAAAAAVLAHVTGDESGDHVFAKSLAAAVSDQRFRRAMSVSEPDELLITLVRLVRLNNGGAPVESLGRDIQRWGDSVKQRWAFAYYETTEAAIR